MTLEDLLVPSPYNKKVIERLEHPRNCGALTQKPSIPLIVATSEKKEEGVVITLYALIDASDGVIADCKFQAIAPPILFAAIDCIAELLVRKNYEQARRITPAMVLKLLDDPEVELNVLFACIEDLCAQCRRLELPTTLTTPLSQNSEGTLSHDWAALTRKEKIALIEQVIQEDIRPYIELDEGGIKVLDLINDKELSIAYEGACTSCYSSIGSTLSSIQEILRSKVHKELVVIPNMDNFKGH